MRREFVVSLEMPWGVTVPEMEQYIEVAVGTWHGGMDPDAPIFDLDGDTVRCHRIAKKRKKKESEDASSAE